MKRAWIVLAVSLLAGCVSSNLTVSIPSPAAPAPGAKPVQVAVRDMRAPGVAASTREAAFGTPMGNIRFDPPEPQLVKNALEAALSKRGGSYDCDIVEFGVNTNTTPLYWDVVASVRLTLKDGDDRVRSLHGTHTERTFVWPGEEVIRKAVEEAMRQVVLGL